MMVRRQAGVLPDPIAQFAKIRTFLWEVINAHSHQSAEGFAVVGDDVFWEIIMYSIVVRSGVFVECLVAIC